MIIEKSRDKPATPRKIATENARWDITQALPPMFADISVVARIFSNGIIVIEEIQTFSGQESSYKRLAFSTTEVELSRYNFCRFAERWGLRPQGLMAILKSLQ